MDLSIGEVMQAVRRVGGWGEFFLRLNDDDKVTLANGLMPVFEPWMLTKEGRRHGLTGSRFKVPLRRIVMPPMEWTETQQFKHVKSSLHKYQDYNRIVLTQHSDSRYLIVRGAYTILALFLEGEPSVNCVFEDFDSLREHNRLCALGWLEPAAAKQALKEAKAAWEKAPAHATLEQDYYRAWMRAGRPNDHRILDIYACDAPWCPERTGDDYDGNAYTFCERHNRMLHLGDVS